MRFFCPGCWKDCAREFEICPNCGLNVTSFYKDKDYPDKLILALGHWEPSTPIRAAWLLGKRREFRAVEALIDVVRQSKDVYLVRAAVEALLNIGGHDAFAFVQTLAGHSDLFVRRLADKAAASNRFKGALKMQEKDTGIHVEIPGEESLVLTQLLLDFTGTLSCDGVLLTGVAQRLEELGKKLNITILTADTFGTAGKQLEGLPVRLHFIRTGQDKADFLAGLNRSNTAAVGNGRNDVAMVRAAALGIAVIGPEGCAGELIAAAKVICPDILTALDLLLRPLRLKATLRA